MANRRIEMHKFCRKRAGDPACDSGSLGRLERGHAATPRRRSAGHGQFGRAALGRSYGFFGLSARLTLCMADQSA